MKENSVVIFIYFFKIFKGVVFFFNFFLISLISCIYNEVLGYGIIIREKVFGC